MLRADRKISANKTQQKDDKDTQLVVGWLVVTGTTQQPNNR